MEVIAGECVKIILTKLLARTTDEFTLMQGSKEEIDALEINLEEINKVLEEAEKLEITLAAKKRWLKGQEDAAFDANNVLDEINYEDLRRKIQTMYKIKLKWCLNIPCYTTLAFQWKMAHKIKDINAKIKMTTPEAIKFHPFGIELGSAPETTSLCADPVVIGRESEESEILEAINTSSNNTLSVLAIVGMGGIGKTTLARKIFNHGHIQNQFGKKIWVSASKKFDDQTTLLEKILELLLKGKNARTCLENYVQMIEAQLKGNRYLIVFDDLWDEKEKDWVEFKNTLLRMNSNEGNFIIVTTREEKVASIVNTCNRPCRLRSLTDDECWSIIRTMVFPDEVPTHLAIKIACKCRGLPLAANVIGGVLRGKTTEEWDSIGQNELSNLEEFAKNDRGVLQVLKFSYNRLPSSAVKKCFAYCSIFIKDSVIYREDLIQLWMAVGLLQENRESEMETTGNTIFNDFLQNFFFQEPEKDEYGNIMSCKMHNFFHDLACLVSKSDDNFQVRQLATTSNGETTQDLKKQATHLRTLFSTSRVQDEILPYFKHLHVLKLSGAAIEELPISIDKLIYLRYLDVSNNDRLTTLPESVCKLYFLQTLRIHDIVHWLPKDLRFLIRLRHLCFVNVGNREMPPEIGRLSDLQTLPSFYVSKKEGCRIDELGKLNNLQGKLRIQNLELVMDKEEAEKAEMARKQNIYELHFQWGSRDGFAVDANAIESNDENVLKGLQPHENLKSLTVEGFQGKNFPEWTRYMRKLIKIEFQNCCKCEEIPMLGHLPLLKYLNIKGLTNVKLISQAFYGGGNDCSSTSSNDGQLTRVSFPSLKHLTIWEMPKLEVWEEAQTTRMQVFPCLEYLKLSRCENLTVVPILLGRGASLKVMEISHCDKLSKLSYDLGSLQSLETLKISYCRNLQSILNQNEQEGLRSLQSLEISNCHELSNLPNEMLEFRTLLVEGCPNLASRVQRLRGD